MANPRWTESSVPRSLPDRVAQLYYSHGLFCATHPFIVLFLAVSIILLCCYPLLSLPWPGNVPQQYASNGNHSTSTSEPPRWLHASSPVCYIQQVVMRAAVTPWTDDLLLTDAYRAPLAEIFSLLEVIQNYQYENSSLTLADVCFHVESAKSKRQRDLLPEYSCLVLSPANFWHQDVNRYNSDSNLISTIYSYQNLQKGKVSLSEILFGLNLKDTGIKRYPLRKRQRIIQFAVTIVLQHYDKQFLDGLHDRLARIYPLHQKTILEASDDLEERSNNTEDLSIDPTLHIYYPGEFHYQEVAPILIIYAILFFYMYFSVRKMELVKSKIGIALSAVFTCVATLLVTLGVCFFFGLELAGHGRRKEVFPYLVCVVGLENVVVLTKSVISTASHLDVKIRIAQGLSREGWSITKNLLSEVTIMTVGLLTLVPDIQEFCIFTLVGSLVDFFLQLFFFTTILALDIRQQEDSTPSSYSSISSSSTSSLSSALPRNSVTSSSSVGGMSRSRSQPRLNGIGGGSSGVGVGGVGVGAGLNSRMRSSKRLKVVAFWARTRIVQRALMLGLVMWIGGIVYSADMLQRFTAVSSNRVGVPLTVTPRDSTISNKFKSSFASGEVDHRSAILDVEMKLYEAHNQTAKQAKSDDSAADLAQLKPSYSYLHHQSVSPHHWAAVLSLHNHSILPGGYLTLLPPIHLAAAISPARATSLRNPFDQQTPLPLQWHSLALALDPLDLTGERGRGGRGVSLAMGGAFVPSSPMELFLTALLCLTSASVVSYTVLVLYRCICSRNYAEWRASWSPGAEKEAAGGGGGGDPVVLEAVPLVLGGSSGGHKQEVECVASDGSSLVVSSCLGGEVCCWDANTGELLMTLDRVRSSTRLQKRRYLGGGSVSSEQSDDGGAAAIDALQTTAHRISKTDPDEDYYHVYPSSQEASNSSASCSSGMTVRNRLLRNPASHRPPSSSSWDMPDLTASINTNFSHNKKNTNNNYSSESGGLVRGGEGGDGFDYGSHIKGLYEDYKKDKLLDVGKVAGGGATLQCKCGDACARVRAPARTFLLFENVGGVGGGEVSDDVTVGESDLDSSPIWCLDCRDKLIVLGCANGRMEFWCASTGKLKFASDEMEGGGLTCVRLVAMGGCQVVAARLSGLLDIYSLSWEGCHSQILHRKTHIRTGSAGSPLECFSLADAVGGGDIYNDNDQLQLHVIRTSSTRAHQQPITVLDVEGGRVLTGSQDHTLKVISLLDQVVVYTLHGHCGPITALFIDHINPSTAGSASQDGMLCVWDLLSGACMYSLQAHDGCITALTYSVSYIISLGADERLCVWERFQGNLLNTIQVSQTYCTSMVMLTHNLLITSKQGSLIVWDVRSGEPVRIVKLGFVDTCLFVQHIVPLRNSVVCDYGAQLRIVRFPLVV